MDTHPPKEKIGIREMILPQKGSAKEDEWMHRPQQKERELSPLSPFTRRILIIDDDPDVTLTFKVAFEQANGMSVNKISFHVDTYNDPLLALSEFKPNFYDLLLVDINMSEMNGFEFALKIMEIDVNPRICYMSSAIINQEALREQYPLLSIGCFVQKPVTMENLIRRVSAELDLT